MPSPWLTLTSIGYLVGELFAGQLLTICKPDEDAALIHDLKKLQTLDETLRMYLALRYKGRMDVGATRRVGVELSEAFASAVHHKRMHDYHMAQVVDLLICDALDLTAADPSLVGAHDILEDIAEALERIIERSNAPREDSPYQVDTLELSERLHKIIFPQEKKGPRRLYCYSGRYVCAQDKKEARRFLRDAFGLVAGKIEAINLRRHMDDGRPFGALIEKITATPCFVGVEE